MGRSSTVGAGLLSAALLATILVVPGAAAAPRYAAVIQRTEFGVPHITSATMGGAGYGFGYAYARDNACLMADHLATLSGERSRWFGPEGSVNTGAGQFSNLDSDTYFRAVNESGKLDALLSSPQGPSAEARETLRGYVAGFNRYLSEKGVSDPTCEGKPWLRPITET
ncbi:penicillin acylase family protein, partial [Crossiella equi]